MPDIWARILFELIINSILIETFPVWMAPIGLKFYKKYLHFGPHVKSTLD
jgi:hypothetical protein